MIKQGVPEITPAYAGTPPSIDGRLDDICWQKASKATGFVLNTNHNKASQQTTVYLCYDARNLYIAFEAMESQMDKLQLQYHQDGQPVWQDDSIEVFIAPFAAPDAEGFHHFAVNAAGAKTYLHREVILPDKDWKAAVTRQSDRWTVEMAIPFSTLAPHGKNEDCWRINFCREAQAARETSSWAPVPTWFDSFWCFGRLCQPATGPKFLTFRSALKPAGCAGSGKGARTVEKVPEASVPSGTLIPTPFETHVKRTGSFQIKPTTMIVVGSNIDQTDLRSAEEINQEIKSRLGYELTVRKARNGSRPPKNAILIGEPKLNAQVKQSCEDQGIRCSADYPGKEGYVLDVDQDRVLIAGSDRLGTFWGAQSLRELVRTQGDSIAGLKMIDKPAFAFRGVHLLSSIDALKFHTKLIEELFSRYKINHIVLQTDKVDWESHPEVTDSSNFMSRDDVKKLIEVAKQHHITVTPLVQTLGHIEWAFRDRKNWGFAEDPEKPYCICPSNPRSYEFLFDIIDEAYELFGHPTYFHAGLDEFDMVGRFPVDDQCKKIGKHELFYRNAQKIYDHLKQKGCRMMMWGDILTTVGYREKISELPKDILINDWRYGPLDKYPSLDFFIHNGFETLGCTWYDPKNICGFSRYAARNKAAGMLQTTWTGWQTEEVILSKWPEQVYAYILGAAWAWNADKPSLVDMPYEPAAVFNSIWDVNKPAPTAKSRWFTVDLCAYTNINTADSGKKVGWLGQGRSSDLRNMPSGLVKLGSAPYQLIEWRKSQSNAIMLKGPSLTGAYPEAVDGIRIDRKADRLHFLHTTAFACGKDVQVGRYSIRYQDGTSERIDLVYGQNISSWNEKMGSMAYGVVWKGLTIGGEIIRLRDFVWENPHPEKTIDAVDFVSQRTQAAPVLLALTGEIR